MTTVLVDAFEGGTLDVSPLSAREFPVETLYLQMTLKSGWSVAT